MVVVALLAIKTLSIYYIGNSVTDALSYQGVAKLAKARGYDLKWGRHMIPGAPLHWLWNHQSDGFSEPPYGTCEQALRDHAWDAVTVQPFDRHLDGEEGDVTVIRKMFDLAVKKNPKVIFFIYARWPRMTWQGESYPFDKNDFDPDKDRATVDLSKVDSYQTRWSAKYTGDWDATNETKEYFDRLIAELKQVFPKQANQFRLLPVGEVFADLDRRMTVGKVPGYRSIYQVYSDGIHLGRLGSYIAGATALAAITGERAVGLPIDSHGSIDPAMARIVQEAVDRVVSGQKSR